MTGTTARAWLPDWIREGVRTLFFCRPRWSRVRATPCMVALLVLLNVLVSIGLARLHIAGDARFYWRAIPALGANLCLTTWVCYLLRSEATSNPARAPSPAYLLCMVLAQGTCLSLFSGLISWDLYQNQGMTGAQPWVQWTVWLVAPVWSVLITLATMLRAGDRKPLRRVIAIVVVLFAHVLGYYLAPQPAFWHAKADTNADQLEPLRFTQDVVENQAPLLEEKVDALGISKTAGLTALLIAWLTIISHALRVARANPIHALRYE